MRFACVVVPHFAAAAHERCEPALRERPLAIVQGRPPATRVVAVNRAGHAAGVRPGLTYAEAQARCATLVTRETSDERVEAARQALLDAALGISPRVEDGGAGIVHVDLAGLARLFGGETGIGERLRRAARAVGMTAAVGIAGTRTAARVAARVGTQVTIVPAGEDRARLARVPVGVLELDASVAATLARWGIRTLGELAALPRAGVGARLGPAGLRAHDEALGHDTEPFRPYMPPPFWEEAQHVDWEITAWTELVPLVRGVLERLGARLRAAHVSADALEIRLALAAGGHDVRAVSFAYPLVDHEPMLTLVALEIEARPPSEPVTGVAISAHAVRVDAAQGGLWHPPSPALRDLAGTLARLAVLVGREHVGSPSVTDTHRPDAVTMAPFLSPPIVDRAPAAAAVSEAALAFRRLRPPRVVDVETIDGQPARLSLHDRAGGTSTVEIVVSAGPWRASGDWWDTGVWARDEWDAVLADGMLCRLVHDRIANAWLLDGAYD